MLLQLKLRVLCCYGYTFLPFAYNFGSINQWFSMSQRFRESNFFDTFTLYFWKDILSFISKTNQFSLNDTESFQNRIAVKTPRPAAQHRGYFFTSVFHGSEAMNYEIMNHDKSPNLQKSENHDRILAFPFERINKILIKMYVYFYLWLSIWDSIRTKWY